MGPPSYMGFVVGRNAGMRRVTVYDKYVTMLDRRHEVTEFLRTNYFLHKTICLN